MRFFNLASDVSIAFEKQCFTAWIQSRRQKLKQPCESYRRVLTAHVAALDGRKPFPESIEKKLLILLRKKNVWPCFKDFPSVTIGIRGFRNLGYHEKINMAKLKRFCSTKVPCSSFKRKLNSIYVEPYSVPNVKPVKHFKNNGFKETEKMTEAILEILLLRKKLTVSLDSLLPIGQAA